MEEDKGVLSLREAFAADEALMCLFRHLKEFLLESRAPRNTVLFLLLDVLARHVCGIVEQSDEALHNALAVVTGQDDFIAIEVLLLQAVVA